MGRLDPSDLDANRAIHMSTYGSDKERPILEQLIEFTRWDIHLALD